MKLNRMTSALGAVLLAGGGLAAPTLLASPASAANPVCGTATAAVGTTAAAPCDLTGTLTLTGGALTATPPTALTWAAGSITGVAKDVVAPQQSIEVDDLTGAGAGWKVTASATQFTGTQSASHTLDAGALTIGPVPDPTDSTGATMLQPSGACVTTGACTLPQNGVSYPQTIGSAATSIFNSAAGKGIGKIKVNNLGWWVHVPADAYADVYTSNITISVVAAP